MDRARGQQVKWALRKVGWIVAGALAFGAAVSAVLPVYRARDTIAALDETQASLVRLAGEDGGLDLESSRLAHLKMYARGLDRREIGILGELFLRGRRRAAEGFYLATLRRDFAVPAHAHLGELVTKPHLPYCERRELLGVYLALGAPEHLRLSDADLLTHLWAHALAPRSQSSAVELEVDLRVSGHVGWYVHDLKNYDLLPEHEPPLPLDAAIVETARRALEETPALARVESCAFEWVAGWRSDPFGPQAPGEEIPALSLDEVVSQPRWLEGRAEVRGLYTGLGHQLVLSRFGQVWDEAEEAGWVVPPEPGERGGELASNLKVLYQRHANLAVAEWTAFLGELHVRPPERRSELPDFYRSLTSPLRYETILLGLEHAMPWPSEESKERKSRYAREPWPRQDAKQRQAWWQALTGFTVPPLEARFAGARALMRRSGQEPSMLRRWAARIDGVREALEREPPDRAKADALRRRALAETEADLSALDELTRRIWGPLLLDPLRFDPKQE